VILGAALAGSTGAAACGVCREDKVAAVYDHGAVERARGAGHVIVFAEVAGEAPAPERVRAARSALARVQGVDRASIRAAEEPAVLSFALDERRRSPAHALAAAERGASGARLRLLEVLR
jgi:hypothetical protein